MGSPFVRVTEERKNGVRMLIVQHFSYWNVCQVLRIASNTSLEGLSFWILFTAHYFLQQVLVHHSKEYHTFHYDGMEGFLFFNGREIYFFKACSRIIKGFFLKRLLHRWDKRRTIAVTAIAVHRTIATAIDSRLRYRWLYFRYTR